MRRSRFWLAERIRIRREPGWRVISVEEPYSSAWEIAQQLLIFIVSHVARPDDFGLVNVGGVINPFPVDIMMWAITHDDQVLTGRVLQFPQHSGTIQVSSGPRRLDWHMCGCGGDTQNHHRDCDQRNDPQPREADRLAMPSPKPQVAH